MLTRVKFYNKGDTIVYNANAFQLAEGSMLDALIEQLPGAEIRSGGEIYIAGKKIDNLLLNGNDFFRGDKSIILSNLPNYMVKDIEVYNKLGSTSELVGRDTGDGEYVMDVKVKKEYASSWLINASGGYGTSDRYHGSLFMTRFNDRSQLTIYANTNNINDERSAGKNDDWSPATMPSGLLTTINGGINYAIKKTEKGNSYNGYINYSDTKYDLESLTNTTNFLSEGDTYNYIQSNSETNNLNLSTSHNVKFDRENRNTNINGSFKYSSADALSNYNYATFIDDYKEYDADEIDNIFVDEVGGSLRETIINRNMVRSKSNGYNINTSLSSGSSIKIKHTPDVVNFGVNASFRQSGENKYVQNQIDYYSDDDVESEFLNQYYNNTPGEGYNIGANANYVAYLPKASMTLTFGYDYKNSYSYNSRAIYALDEISGYGVGTQYDLGVLPSVSSYENTLDLSNSYESKLYGNDHTLKASLVWQKRYEKSEVWVQLGVPVSFNSQRLNYNGSGTDTTINRNYMLMQLSSSFIEWKTLDGKHNLSFYTNLNSSAPNITYLVDATDSSDPLNIRIGNSDLKNSYTHTQRLIYKNTNSKNQQVFYVAPFYSGSTNSLSMGYTYNMTTGVKIIQPENVNGNWNAGAQLYYDRPLDKNKKLTLRSVTDYKYINSVDLIEVEGAEYSSKSEVQMNELTENLRLNYKITNSSSIGLKAIATWTNAVSDREDFNEINICDINYGVVANLSLPWKFNLAADLSMYSRKNYEDCDLNSNDLVCNARLSRSILNGSMMFIIDGYDIFKQLSNVSRVVNVQGYTETYTNVIPSYFMFRINYKLNVLPKKR